MWEVKWEVPCCILYTWCLNDPVWLQTADKHTHRVSIIFSIHMLGFFFFFFSLFIFKCPDNKKNAAGLESFCRHPRRRHRDEGSSSEGPPVSFGFFSSRQKAAVKLCRELGAAVKFFPFQRPGRTWRDSGWAGEISSGSGVGEIVSHGVLWYRVRRFKWPTCEFGSLCSCVLCSLKIPVPFQKKQKNGYASVVWLTLNEEWTLDFLALGWRSAQIQWDSFVIHEHLRVNRERLLPHA